MGRMSFAEGRGGVFRAALALLLAVGPVFAGGSATASQAIRREVVEGRPAGDLRKARFECWIPDHPRGALVLVDGQNLPATALTDDPDWRRFAAEHGLALVGAEFRSDDTALRFMHGYYDAPDGAGSALLGALAEVGLGGKPLLMYGISGGARFINSFLGWRPEAVAGWAAFSTAEWVMPVAGVRLPPGLVACGQYDDSRYGRCLAYLQAARALRQPVAWVSIAKLPHRRSLELEDFTREFFDAILRPRAGEGPVAVDLVKETVMEPKEGWQWMVSGELPSPRLLRSWRELNAP